MDQPAAEVTTPTFSQIGYFPYLCMGRKPITFEGVTLWNFSLEANSRIPDENLRLHLTKLLNANVRRREVIKNIGILDLGTGFLPFSDRQKKCIKEFKAILFLCSVAKTNIFSGPNAEQGMVTSDNFTLIFQNFQVGSFSTAFSTGSIVNILSGGYGLDEVVYEAPPYVLKRSLSYDEKLMEQLVKVKKKKPSVYQRIVRSTEAFMSSYFNSDEMSFEGRILQQTRAFEILFDLPPGQRQRLVFKDLIEKYCSPENAKKYRFKFETFPGLYGDELGTMQRQWADRFFTLRNHIIHGQNIKLEQLKFHGKLHQDLGLWFFLVAVKKVTDMALNKEMFYDVINFEKKTFAYDSRFYYGIVFPEIKKQKQKQKKIRDDLKSIKV